MPSAVKHTLVGMIHRIWHGSPSSVLSPAALPRTPFSERSPSLHTVQSVLGLSTGYPHSLKCPLHPLEQTQRQISVPLQLLFVQQLLHHPKGKSLPCGPGLRSFLESQSLTAGRVNLLLVLLGSCQLRIQTSHLPAVSSSAPFSHMTPATFAFVSLLERFLLC